MEEIYMKGFFSDREWCSNKVDLKSYFDEYINQLGIVSSNKIHEVDILNHLVPQSAALSHEEILILAESSHAGHLTNMSSNDMIRKHVKEKVIKKENLPSTMVAPERNNWRKGNRIRNETSRVKRAEVYLNSAVGDGPRDIAPRKTYQVAFRIQEPFNHRTGEVSKVGQCQLQLNMLSGQLLSTLADKIICETQYQDVRGDVSDRPDQTPGKLAKDVYHSSMFYFDNTFYIDTRHRKNEDYSKPLKQWALSRGIKLGKTQPMEKTQIEELQIRFGYPYVFMHQGNCEHLIVISDARLVSSCDSLCSSDYPLITRLTHNNVVYCQICAINQAKWIVGGSDRLVHDPTFECKECFQKFHYIDGKKVGQFKAYQFWQRSSVL